MATSFGPLSDLADTTVGSAPSPASSGTSLTVASSTGGWFPSSFPFDVAIGPVSTVLNRSNTEIAKCTGRTGDVLTITRAQYGTSARSIIAGDRIALVLTWTYVQALETAINALENSTLIYVVPSPYSNLDVATALAQAPAQANIVGIEDKVNP